MYILITDVTEMSGNNLVVATHFGNIGDQNIHS